MSTILPRKNEVIEAEMVAVLREKSPAERLAIAHGMWSHARLMILNVVRAEHPDWTTDQVNHETARRISHGAI